jgi:hypothetical protein
MRHRLATVALTTALGAGLALGLVGCPDDKRAMAKLQRPVPPQEGTPTARVIHASGAVRVLAGSAEFDAMEGQDLVDTDVVQAAPKAFVILQLHNGWMVRLDDAGPLAVADLLMRDAPGTNRPAAEQLAELLDAGEELPIADVEIERRAAAWRQSRRAAESVGAAPGASEPAAATGEAAPPTAAAQAATDELLETESSAAGDGYATDSVVEEKSAGAALKERVAEAPADRDLDVAAGGGKKKSKSAKGGSRSAGASTSTKASGLPGADAARDGKADSPAGAKDAPPPRAKAPRRRPTPAGITARFGPKVTDASAAAIPPSLTSSLPALSRCLSSSTRSWRVRLPHVEVQLRLDGGQVTRVRLGGGLPVPACARAVVGSALPDAPAAEGWLVLRLPVR